MNDMITRIQISTELSIKEALKKIDEVGLATLFVCDENGSLLGSLTDGDIRRRVLSTCDLQEKIIHCFNRNPIYVLKNDYTVISVRKLMLENAVEVIPVLDEKRCIIDILFWKDIFEKEITPSYSNKKIDIPIVIMAGGIGERLSPFTKIFPKPLIPIGDKPIIEAIIEKFRRYNAKSFFITLNYKGEMIKNYLDSVDKDYTVEYVWEKEFLGTAGSLKSISLKLNDVFIVSNSDIIVDVDYNDLVNFHRENQNILTVVGSIQHHKVSYGVIQFEKNGRITKIHEKPEFDMTVNTGLYVLSSSAIDFISSDGHYDMTDLIQALIDENKKVCVYPVSQKSYIDVGEWQEYKKAADSLQVFK